MSRVLGIDPSNLHSAFCVMDSETFRPIVFDKVENEVLRESLRSGEIQFDEVAIEDMQNFGSVMGRTCLDTEKEIGRLMEILETAGYTVNFVYRTQEKMCICHTVKANDATIRRALIDKFATTENGKGTKQRPDFFYKFREDIWNAYAVALVHALRGERLI